MKILFDDVIFELQRAGGISKYWSKLIENFTKNNETELINIQGEDAHNNVFYPPNEKLNVVSDGLLPLRIKRYLPIFNAPQYSIFHSSYYRVPFFSNKNMKQIVTVHDFMYEFFDSGFKKHIHTWQKRKAMFHADAIICVSEHTKKDLLQLYPNVNPKILHVVPNGVDKEFTKLKTIKQNVKVEHLSLPPKTYLLYVGNRGKCKNFEFTLKIMRNSTFVINKKIHLVCVGGGEFSKLEKNLIKSYDLAQKINQVLNINNEQLNYLYNGAFALLFPSKYEGFGIPALEAQMAGCPVVYAKTSSLPEVMGYEELGHELDNLPEALIKLESLEDEKIRNQIIGKGIKHASGLSWNNCAQLTLEVYKNVLKNG